MPKRKVDPLGRNHGTVQKPLNRHNVDRVCYHVLNWEKGNFQRWPTAKHVYYDAYVVIYGTAAAIEMLRKAQEENQ